jgi:hypothetical protein
MTNIPDNIRLKELALIAHSNREFFNDFVSFLHAENYASLHRFVVEKDAEKAQQILEKYFNRKLPFGYYLYDGLARPYPENKGELPDVHRYAIERGLPNSSAIASAVVDLRPYRFGLTLPPRAVALVPNGAHLAFRGVQKES